MDSKGTEHDISWQLVKEQPVATSILAGVLEAQGASNLSGCLRRAKPYNLACRSRSIGCRHPLEASSYSGQLKLACSCHHQCAIASQCVPVGTCVHPAPFFLPGRAGDALDAVACLYLDMAGGAVLCF